MSQARVTGSLREPPPSFVLCALLVMSVTLGVNYSCRQWSGTDGSLRVVARQNGLRLLPGMAEATDNLSGVQMSDYQSLSFLRAFDMRCFDFLFGPCRWCKLSKEFLRRLSRRFWFFSVGSVHRCWYWYACRYAGTMYKIKQACLVDAKIQGWSLAENMKQDHAHNSECCCARNLKAPRW